MQFKDSLSVNGVYLTPKEYAAEVGVAVNTVYIWMRSREKFKGACYRPSGAKTGRVLINLEKMDQEFMPSKYKEQLEEHRRRK